MPDKHEQLDANQALLEELLGHERRMQNVHLGWKIYQDYLTEDERRRVGSFEQAFSDRFGRTVGLWMQAKGVGRLRAIVEIARCFGLPDAEYERLLRRLGEAKSPIPRLSQIPWWDPERCVLLLDGEVIKQIQRPVTARNQVRILNAFQEDCWRPRIDDPLPRLPEADGSRQLADAVRRLNQGLLRIRFRRDGTGEGIRWEVVSPAVNTGY